MNRELQASKYMVYWRIIAYSVYAIVVLAISFYFTELRALLNHEYQQASLPSLVSGTAAKPFQYRVLIPWLVGLLSGSGLPGPLSGSTVLWFGLFEFSSVACLVFAFRSYLSQFFRSEVASTLLSFTLFLVLPFNFLMSRSFDPWYPWDMPSILFFTLGLLLLYKRNWLLYYPLFAVATLNRETTIFLTLIFFFTALGKHRFKTLALHCLSQLAIWVVIKYALTQIYANNVGAFLVEDHLAGNIALLANPANYPFLSSNMGFIWLPVLFGFRLIRPDFVRRSVYVGIPFVFGMMFVGRIDELRIYGELTPVMLMAFLLIARESFEKVSLAVHKRLPSPDHV